MPTVPGRSVLLAAAVLVAGCGGTGFITVGSPGGDQQLLIDWLPSGEISVSYVVGH